MCLRSRSILRPLLDSGTCLPKTRPCSKCRIGLAPCFAGRGVFQRATVSVIYSEDIARALDDGSAAKLATRLPVASNCRTPTSRVGTGRRWRHEPPSRSTHRGCGGDQRLRRQSLRGSDMPRIAGRAWWRRPIIGKGPQACWAGPRKA